MRPHPADLADRTAQGTPPGRSPVSVQARTRFIWQLARAQGGQTGQLILKARRGAGQKGKEGEDRGRERASEEVGKERKARSKSRSPV